MPWADVVVVGAGLSGYATAHALAARGARVVVLAAGHAATHWVAGPLDIATIAGTLTPRASVARLAAQPGHPYAIVADDVPPAVATFLDVVGRQGLPYVGDLDTPPRPQPTGIGGIRPAAIVPAAQADALAPWAPDEQLVVCGFAGFKDLWPAAVAASLDRPRVWAMDDGGAASGGPARVVAAVAELPGIAKRHNLNALHLARSFDDSGWRADAIDAIARVVDRALGRQPGRVALPAALGLREHAAVLEAVRTRLGRPVFELPLVPPSIPGMRLHDAWRAVLRGAGVRIQVGAAVSRVVTRDGEVEAVITPASVRELSVRTRHLVLATGGITGGGIVGLPDGRLEETVLGLPVEAPPRAAWFADDAFDPAGHPIEGAGIRTDDELRPLGEDGHPLYPNVRIVGSLLAGQRWLRERCGDGVAIASAHRAAHGIEAGGFGGSSRPAATADTTGAQVRAHAPAAAGRSSEEV